MTDTTLDPTAALRSTASMIAGELHRLGGIASQWQQSQPTRANVDAKAAELDALRRDLTGAITALTGELAGIDELEATLDRGRRMLAGSHRATTSLLAQLERRAPIETLVADIEALHAEAAAARTVIDATKAEVHKIVEFLPILTRELRDLADRLPAGTHNPASAVVGATNAAMVAANSLIKTLR